MLHPAIADTSLETFTTEQSDYEKRRAVTGKAKISGILQRPLLATVLVGVSLLTGSLIILKSISARSLHRADCIELRSVLQRWHEAKKPEGRELDEFMRGRRTDLVASNRVFHIGAADYVTRFALTQPRSGRGILFVTTNGVFLWMEPSGHVKVTWNRN